MKVTLKRIRTRHVGPFKTHTEEVLLKEVDGLMLTAEGKLVLAGSFNREGRLIGSVPLEFDEVEVMGFTA